MRLSTLGILLTLALTLTSCSIFKPYHMDIQQGNEITADEITKIHTGMTQKEVLKVLGQPIQSDALTADRLDYTYTSQIKGEKIKEKQLTLLFNNDKLTKIISKDYIDQPNH